MYLLNLFFKLLLQNQAPCKVYVNFGGLDACGQEIFKWTDGGRMQRCKFCLKIFWAAQYMGVWRTLFALAHRFKPPTMNPTATLSSIVNVPEFKANQSCQKVRIKVLVGCHRCGKVTKSLGGPRYKTSRTHNLSLETGQGWSGIVGNLLLMPNKACYYWSISVNCKRDHLAHSTTR